jgi:hypothetical protein
MATRGALRRRRLSALGIGWLVLLPFKLRGLRSFLPDGGGDLNKGLQCGANENKWVLDENCTELDGDDTHEPPWSDEEDDGD